MPVCAVNVCRSFCMCGSVAGPAAGGRALSLREPETAPRTESTVRRRQSVPGPWSVRCADAGGSPSHSPPRTSTTHASPRGPLLCARTALARRLRESCPVVVSRVRRFEGGIKRGARGHFKQQIAQQSIGVSVDTVSCSSRALRGWGGREVRRRPMPAYLASELRQITAFEPLQPPLELGMEVGVAVFLDTLIKMDTLKHVYDARIRSTFRWLDPRNYSRLFVNAEGQRQPWVSVANSDCVDRLTFNSSQLPGQYIALSADAAALLWAPDLEMRNIYDEKYNRILSSSTRLYQGGVVERVDQRYVNLLLDSPYYGAYPFDEQSLTVEFQSLSLPADRLTLTPIDALSGFDRSKTHTWPGWSPSGKPVVAGALPDAPAIWAAGAGLNPRWPNTQLNKNLIYPQSRECSYDADARSAYVFSLAIKRLNEKVLSGPNREAVPPLSFCLHRPRLHCCPPSLYPTHALVAHSSSPSSTPSGLLTTPPVAPSFGLSLVPLPRLRCTSMPPRLFHPPHHACEHLLDVLLHQRKELDATDRCRFHLVPHTE